MKTLCSTIYTPADNQLSQLMELWFWSLQAQQLISNQLTSWPCCLTPTSGSKYNKTSTDATVSARAQTGWTSDSDGKEGAKLSFAADAVLSAFYLSQYAS